MIVQKPNYLEVIELFPCEQEMYTLRKDDFYMLRTVLVDVNPARYCIDVCITDPDGELKPIARCIWSNGVLAYKELEMVKTLVTFRIAPGSKFNMDEKFKRLVPKHK